MKMAVALQSSNSNSFSGSGITNNGHHLGGKNRQIDLEMIYEVDDMIDDSSGRGKDTECKVNPYHFGTFCNFWGEKHQIDLEMIYKVDDMIDGSSGRGKDTKLSGIVLALFVSFW